MRRAINRLTDKLRCREKKRRVKCGGFGQIGLKNLQEGRRRSQEACEWQVDVDVDKKKPRRGQVLDSWGNGRTGVETAAAACVYLDLGQGARCLDGDDDWLGGRERGMQGWP